MKTKYLKTVLFISALALMQLNVSAQCFTCASAPAGVFWCDDFEDTVLLSQKYWEYGDNNGEFIRMNGVGRGGGRAMRALWQAAEIGAGDLKKSFGRTPSSYIGKHAVNPTQDYDEIYWRIDVRLQPGWTGGGGYKLSRATCLANSNWAQGMMAHMWSAGGSNDNYLAMDPASGIDVNGNLVSTTYNDFPNLRWLGLKAGTTPLFQSSNAGNWYCVETHVKLNTPGQSDGIMEFWINGVFQAGTYNLNWHGNYNSNPNNFKINTVMIENYWNTGSPVLQERYLDNFMISTQPIGCSCSAAGTNEISKEVPMISVYPNPFTESTNVDFSNIKKSAKDNLSFHLYNVLGKEVAAYNNVSNDKLVFEKKGLAQGVYLYRIMLNEQYIGSGKLVLSE